MGKNVSEHKSSSQNIVGKYYVVDFYNFLTSGFELKLEKPKDAFLIYTLEFKENGEIIFDDLTKFYECGNGIFSIEKGNWKTKSKTSYELTFDGEYALDYKFHSKSQYNLTELNNGDKNLKLEKVIINSKNTDWD